MNEKKYNFEKLKEFFRRLFIKIKNFLSIKKNVIIVLIVLFVVVVTIFLIAFLPKRNNKFALNETYDVYPEEVRALYSNMVGISCIGDLHLDIKLDGGKVDIKNVDKKTLLNYTFSYLDKSGLLASKDLISTIRRAEDELFDEKIDLVDEVKQFQFNDYVYNLSGTKIKSEAKKCQKPEVTYVTHLYGFFWDNQNMSMDVNIGYLKNGILYGLDDKKFGEYDGDVSKLSSLMGNASYYRFNYTRKGKNNYRLSSVEWKNRT